MFIQADICSSTCMKQHHWLDSTLNPLWFLNCLSEKKLICLLYFMWFLDIDQIYVIEIPFKKSKMLPISMVADIVNIGTEGLGISGDTSSAGVILAWCVWLYINGSVPDCSISCALAIEILQSCTKPLIRTVLCDYRIMYSYYWINILILCWLSGIILIKTLRL